MPKRNPISGAVIAIQTFADFLGFNPHCHVLVTDGCFYGKRMFRIAPFLDLKKLEAIFRHKVFKMLLAKGRITQDLIAMLSNWRHSGNQVFCGQRIFPRDATAMENPVWYIYWLSSPRNGGSILRNRQRLFAGRKMESRKRSLTRMGFRHGSHIPNRGEKWASIKDSATLSGLTVQFVILIPILNRP